MVDAESQQSADEKCKKTSEPAAPQQSKQTADVQNKRETHVKKPFDSDKKPVVPEPSSSNNIFLSDFILL